MTHKDSWTWQVAEEAYKGMPHRKHWQPWDKLTKETKRKWFRYAEWIMQALDRLGA